MEHRHTRWLLIVTLTLVVGSCKKDDDTPAPATGTNSPSYPPGYPSTITDIDGNVYFTVSIGDQRWMAENLRTTHYTNGTEIPLGFDPLSWIAAGTASTHARVAYQHNATNVAVYGFLYNWYAATDPRGICPQGWHVPTDAEWMRLETTLGMPEDELDQFGAVRGSAQNVGGRLKSTSAHWLAPNVGATNTSGFSGLPGGYRSGSTGDFQTLTISGAWWSTTGDQDPSLALSRALNHEEVGVQRASATKSRGFCVRCVAD